MQVSIPERVNARWIATLENDQLVDAEQRLHEDFRNLDSAEKAARGTRYRLMQGSQPLMDSWMAWRLADNEARRRGLAAKDRR
jgi:hypothetical protein